MIDWKLRQLVWSSAYGAAFAGRIQKNIEQDDRLNTVEETFKLAADGSATFAINVANAAVKLLDHQAQSNVIASSTGLTEEK